MLLLNRHTHTHRGQEGKTRLRNRQKCVRVCGGYDEEGRDMKLKGKEKSEPETEKDKERQKLKKNRDELSADG